MKNPTKFTPEQHRLAGEYVNSHLDAHGIVVSKFRKSSSGCAYMKPDKFGNWHIEMPVPSDSDRFGVCMHEIKHVLDYKARVRAPRFESEFYCDKFALDHIKELGFGGEQDWIRRMRWHSLSRIAMAVNRGLGIRKINREIREFFMEINFREWDGMSVFVCHSDSTPLGYVVDMVKRMSANEIAAQLRIQGYKIFRTEFDDSTYGNWLVVDIERDKRNAMSCRPCGMEFPNLPAVVRHFAL